MSFFGGVLSYGNLVGGGGGLIEKSIKQLSCFWVGRQGTHLKVGQVQIL